MLKALLVGAVVSLAGVAAAEPVATLSHPAQTLSFPARAAQLTVFFSKDPDSYDVTMLFRDHSGDVLRSRVRLKDTQVHSVTLRDERTDLRTEYRIERMGKFIGVHVTELDADRRLAEGPAQRRSNVK